MLVSRVTVALWFWGLGWVQAWPSGDPHHDEPMQPRHQPRRDQTSMLHPTSHLRLTMASHQRSTSAMDTTREKTYFEQQREALIGEIAMVRSTPQRPYLGHDRS